jgi:hypothetical protein
MIVGVRDQHAVGAGDCDVMRVLQLPKLGAKGAKLAHERAVGLEHLR